MSKRLEEIKEANRCSDHEDIWWLIDRVEKLEKVKEAAIAYKAYQNSPEYWDLTEALKKAEE